MERSVLYIGNSETYNIFSDVAEQTETKIVPYYAVSRTKEEIVNAAISGVYAMIILNIAEIVVAVDSIVDIIKTIQASTKTRFVVMASGYSKRSSVVVAAAKAGVNYFMLNEDATGLKETYINTMAGIKNVNQIVDSVLISDGALQDAKGNIVSAAERFSSISVGIAGCIDRIGVTSVAIQLIKFFLSVGKTACLIDNSDTGYVELCREYYGVDNEDEEMHRITIEGVDMYYNVTAEILQRIELKNYNFMIYDIGNISDLPQKQTDFLKKKYRLLVTGDKPNEMKAFDMLIQNIYRTHIVYLYNFVPQSDREYILEDIKKQKQECYFVPFYDECFSLSSESVPIFQSIFSEELPKPQSQENEQQKKKKKLLFGKKKKDKI